MKSQNVVRNFTGCLVLVILMFASEIYAKDTAAETEVKTFVNTLKVDTPLRLGNRVLFIDELKDDKLGGILILDTQKQDDTYITNYLLKAKNGSVTYDAKTKQILITLNQVLTIPVLPMEDSSLLGAQIRRAEKVVIPLQKSKLN